MFQKEITAKGTLVTLLIICSTPVLSQTTWFKYEGNPVLDVGPTGSWDGAIVHTGRVIFQGSLYRMWYSGFQGIKFWRLGYATSLDGVRWTKYDANPILDVSLGAWDNQAVGHSYVMRNGSKYEMWYTGLDSAIIIRLGYASSPDGIRWKKAMSQNPILDVGPPGSWDSRGLARPSILGPDSVGGFKMWLGGTNIADGSVVRIGYATGTNATSWTKHSDPVLTVGEPGSWDDYTVFFPRVLFNKGIYEMWYGGMRKLSDRRIGYATSRDGIHWTKTPENPVLLPGPAGSWDGSVVMVGDILFDGRVYHMWYSGRSAGEDMGVGRMGYAISPKGMSVSISPKSAQVGSPVTIHASVPDPVGLSFSAEIESANGNAADLIDLFDDGAHGDDLAGDGRFANSWFPKEENLYSVNLKLRYRRQRFEMKKAATFTTIGPIRCESVEFLRDSRPQPGDTVLIKLVLRNHGTSATANSVTASLSVADSFIMDIATTSPTYGDIASGRSATTSGYYRLFIDPKCPPNTDVKLNVTISSSGTTLWHDSFAFRALAPWWRTEWAYGLYAFVLLGSIIGTIRFVEVRKLKRRIQQLERDRALERERTRISEDMHDEVGARLTEIGILSELARKSIEDPRQAEMQIHKISETSREVIANIGEIIWAINAKNDSLDDLVAYLREYTSKYLGTTAIKCTFEIPDAIPELHLSTEARRNIFLVVKEAVHNIVKHSGATDVRMRVSFLSEQIEIRIEDNGRGFDTEQSSRFGNGLRNMEKRMNEIGGTFEIWSKAGQGTKVAVRIGYLIPNT